jgi:hypothetical protein
VIHGSRVSSLLVRLEIREMAKDEIRKERGQISYFRHVKYNQTNSGQANRRQTGIVRVYLGIKK